MAFGRVHTGLEQNYPIRILFDGECAVTAALIEILTAVRRALESILGHIMSQFITLHHRKALIGIQYC